jgi:hypothetical protein
MGVVLVVAFVAFLAAHGALVVGLARRAPWWRALAGLALPPLAPWWGWHAGMRRRALAWGIALVVYAGGVAVALR